MTIIKNNYAVVDYIYSGYLEDFIRDYAIDMELGQNSYFTFDKTDINWMTSDYPEHKGALEVFKKELEDSGKSECLVMFWF